MLIFNTYNIINLKKDLMMMMFEYIIKITIITYVQQLLLHTVGGYLATRKCRNLPYHTIKQLPWQPDIQFLLDFMLYPVGNIDVALYGFMLISINNKVKSAFRFCFLFSRKD